MNVETFFDPKTFTLTYVVYDARTRDAVVIDPVLDYDPQTSTTSTASVEAVERFIREQGLRPHWILETHAHADHLSGAQYLKRRFEAGVVIGKRIVEVQEVFRDVFDLGPAFATDGSQFDRLVGDGEELSAGAFTVSVLETPGHTPACVSYLVGDMVFTGDALFIEDYGTGRCDFPKGDADALYTSVHDKLYHLPDATRVFVGHDYQPNGRPLRAETTIAASKARNIQLTMETPRDTYVALRRSRDATLAPPRLLYPSIQVNVDAGHLPGATPQGIRLFKVPVDLRRATERDGTRRSAA